MQKASGRPGSRVEEPIWAEVARSNPKDFINEIKKCNPQQVQIALVCLKEPKIKSEIKRELDKMGVPSQFVLPFKHFDKRKNEVKIVVVTNIMSQMTAKVKKDLYRLNISSQTSRMVVGFDYVLSNREFVLGFTASYNRYLTQHYSTVVRQSAHKEVLDAEREDHRNKKDVQEEVISKERA
mmetsp:Transcript_34437/g.25526  ORF Transcript_34437/g.25526 Transcript_34437/m.25526 type:complete len:181 (+) Transcript_34437:1239-1781(+)